jgi:hypothetical protein
MITGVYQKVAGNPASIGKLYVILGPAREHKGVGPDVVVYIPLRVEPEWAGTLRFCYLERTEFEREFRWVGEGLPAEVERQ